MTDALIDGEEEKKNHLLYMSDGAYELGLERGWGGGGGVVSQQCQLCEQEQEVRRLETHSRRPPPTDVMSHGHSLTPRPEAAAVNRPRC